MARTTVSRQIEDNSIASVAPGSAVACGADNAITINVQAITALAGWTRNTTASGRAAVVVVRPLYVIDSGNENCSNSLNNDCMGVASWLVFSAFRCMVRTSVHAIVDHSRVVVGNRESGTGGS